MPDPYQILGLSRGASQEEVNKAYRKLARLYHPDLNPGNAESERKMKEINAAYEAIKAGKTQGDTASGAYHQYNPYSQYQSRSGQSEGYTWYTYRTYSNSGENEQDPFEVFFRSQQSRRPVRRFSLGRLILIIIIIRILVGLLSGLMMPYRSGFYYAPPYGQTYEASRPA